MKVNWRKGDGRKLLWVPVGEKRRGVSNEMKKCGRIIFEVQEIADFCSRVYR